MTGTDSSQGPRLVAERYRLTEVLGRGGMGIVWRATDERIGRTVAVKELRVPHGLPTREQAAFGERALREARTAGRVRHPGVIAVHDLIPGTAQDNTVYVVMELVEAPSLATVLEEHGALPESRVARLGLRLLEALDAAHAIGLIHRDIKPSNILVLPNDKVKLVDFGIAHAIDDTRLTSTGVAGSTGYIAPELFEGHSPTPATDLWSLGVTLHHAATGRSPFERGSTAATIRAILHDDPPPLDHHPALAPAIEGLLVREPSGRMGGPEAAVCLRAAIVSARETDSGSVRRNARPDEGAGRPAAWQNRTTSRHGPAGARGLRARASTTGQASALGRNPASGSPVRRGPADDSAAALHRREAQLNNGGSRRLGWEERPTSVRNTAPPARSPARSRAAGRASDNGNSGEGTEPYTTTPSKPVRYVASLFLIVLSGLIGWAAWRILQLLTALQELGILPVPLFVLAVPSIGLAAAFAFVTALRTAPVVWWRGFALGTEGITVFPRDVRPNAPGNVNLEIAWEHIDGIVLATRPRAEITGRSSRTAVTLHIAATVPAAVKKRVPLFGAGRFRGTSGFTWRMGDAHHSADKLDAAFRAAAPPHVGIRIPPDPDAEGLRHHGPRLIRQTVAVLALAGIVVATYAFTPHDDGPVQLATGGWASAVEFSPDGKTFASSTAHSVDLWNVATRKKITALTGNEGDISTMRFTPDGSLLAAADDDVADRTIRVWDVSGRKERRALRLGDDDTVVSLAFSPDNHTIASVVEDGTIVVWDVRSGRRTTTLHEMRSGAFPVEFSATGRYLYGVDDETRRHRWDVVSGRPVSASDDDEDAATIYRSAPKNALVLDGSGTLKHALIGHRDKITDIAWAGASSDLLATNSLDRTIRIWHTGSGEIARSLVLDRDHGVLAEAIALSPDGTVLVYTSGGKLWVWETGIEA
ncbi:protein kinase [Streptomyces sp. NPDC014991]|uniref:WD40 repeat domain-containing serine/threonine protein kinase n=1 Tax=Streptomyces sp. NPDC014991 TaxID=3364935 RepID=UPI0036FB1160